MTAEVTLVETSRGRRRTAGRASGVAVAWVLALSGCAHAPASSGAVVPGPAAAPAGTAAAAELAARAREKLGSLSALPAAAVNPQWAGLGRRLFFERGVSADGKVGCVTCHDAEHAGADGLARSKGVFGRDNPRNAPTIWNVATQYAQHWRGDRESVEDQATKALLGKASFGLESNEQALEKMRAIPGLPEAFASTFPDAQPALSVENWGKAIGAYERTLRASSPFDAFVDGELGALSAQAQRGLAAFLDLGCASCHSGPLLGGNGARKFGVQTDYWALTGSQPIDNGRFDVTQQEPDRYVFKVPALRNVAATAPYFHDGSVADLGNAVAVMARTQLGSTLAPDAVADLVAFLQSLSSAAPADFTAP
jgi:cytochrome c peroxidase